MQFLNKPDFDAENIKKEDWDNPRIEKYTKKYKGLKEKAAKEMSEKVAKEKHKKRVDFLIELIKAAIIALFTLAVEHFGDIVRFFKICISNHLAHNLEKSSRTFNVYGTHPLYCFTD